MACLDFKERNFLELTKFPQACVRIRVQNQQKAGLRNPDSMVFVPPLVKITANSGNLINSFLQRVIAGLISIADPDPGSGAFLTPGSGMGKKSASGSGMNNPDHIFEQCCGSGSGRTRNFLQDPAGSGINHYRSGSDLIPNFSVKKSHFFNQIVQKIGIFSTYIYVHIKYRYVYIYVNAHIYVHIHTYTYTTHTHTHIYTYVYIYTYICVCVYLYM